MPGHRPTGAATAAPGDAARAHALRRVLERVLRSDHPGLERLAAADTTVTFAIPTVPDASVTLLLDRTPLVLTDGNEPAEITVELTAAQAARMAAGGLILPCEALDGRVRYRGPIRKYLTVDPVLRHLLAEVDDLRRG